MLTIPGTRPNEHFVLSRVTPRIWCGLSVQVFSVLFRLTYWGPYPFLSVFLGVRQDEVHAWGFQAYVGIKADGTQSLVYQRPVMVLTLKELASVRVHTVDLVPMWHNQGGY
jgi:hypothetical protein